MRTFSRSRLFFSALAVTGFVMLFGVLFVGFDIDEDGSFNPSTSIVSAQDVDINESEDECVVCHLEETPGIVQQYGDSDHFREEVTCADCHVVDADYPGSNVHPGADFSVLPKSSPAQCSSCHRSATNQFNQSRHGLRATLLMLVPTH